MQTWDIIICVDALCTFSMSVGVHIWFSRWVNRTKSSLRLSSRWQRFGVHGHRNISCFPCMDVNRPLKEHFSPIYQIIKAINQNLPIHCWKTISYSHIKYNYTTEDNVKRRMELKFGWRHLSSDIPIFSPSLPCSSLLLPDPLTYACLVPPCFPPKDNEFN